jgi:hypothetical protein
MLEVGEGNEKDTAMLQDEKTNCGSCGKEVLASQMGIK